MIFAYRLSYVLCGKYDLVMVEEATDGYAADQKARLEMKKDQLPIQGCQLIDVELMHIVGTE